MSRFAFIKKSWFNDFMKINDFSIKNKIISKIKVKEAEKTYFKSTDINVLLNRVKNNQKNESRKKIYFSAIASTGLLVFGLIIFQ